MRVVRWDFAFCSDEHRALRALKVSRGKCLRTPPCLMCLDYRLSAGPVHSLLGSTQAHVFVSGFVLDMLSADGFVTQRWSNFLHRTICGVEARYLRERSAICGPKVPGAPCLQEPATSVYYGFLISQASSIASSVRLSR